MSLDLLDALFSDSIAVIMLSMLAIGVAQSEIQKGLLGPRRSRGDRGSRGIKRLFSFPLHHWVE